MMRLVRYWFSIMWAFFSRVSARMIKKRTTLEKIGIKMNSGKISVDTMPTIPKPMRAEIAQPCLLNVVIHPVVIFLHAIAVNCP